MPTSRGIAVGAAAVAVQRTEIRACEPDEGVEVIKALLIDHRARITLSGAQAMRVEVRSAAVGGLSASILRFPGFAYHGEGEPADALLAGVLLSGAGHFTTGKQELALSAGEMFLMPSDSNWVTGLRNPVYAVVGISPAMIAEHAAEACELSGRRLRFHGLAPLAGKQRLWTDTATFLFRQLVESGAQTLEPLVLHGLERLTTTALLTVFPNSTMTADYIPGPGRTAPATIRRAAQFIEDHAAEPLTLTGIAAAARIGPRALQSGFRRHLDTTPLHYLRRVRLSRAHQELLAADPGSGATVETIAARWGFTHQARFAAWYREVYGVLPSRTLRD
ncbi:AraC family transcriptional regulator [Nocardia huaxiensis]|uniref:AraC family transcriptional regulator n=1 Tax=Nocardia huaxiensis TaxID=2755382 RepID=A0A7D6V7Y4_9NOCA|nr:helix-turn-helix transcriptional regulator [Nocardia huaxiensis]QLY28571.1 AraC family transcriptional regulator [Nocardia huaxiensis]